MFSHNIKLHDNISGLIPRLFQALNYKFLMFLIGNYLINLKRSVFKLPLNILKAVLGTNLI